MIRSMEEFVSAFHAARCVSTPLVAARTADPASITQLLIEALRQGRDPPPLLTDLSQLRGQVKGKCFVFSEGMSKVGTTFSISVAGFGRPPGGP